jgi:colanic acid biosynthesis glycosyl transferase WcaI
MAQELSFAAAQTLAAPFLRKPDVLVSTSPSFLALLPGIFNSRLRRVRWILWLQDILPDGAAATGFVKRSGFTYRSSRRLETEAYRTADHIVVLSENFRHNLRSKGVPPQKISIAYNPATMFDAHEEIDRGEIAGAPRILCMGNIGKSQGLTRIVEAFESNERLQGLGAELAFAGAGVAEEEVRASARSDRVKFLGVLRPADLKIEIARSHLGAVTQAYEGGEFNVPSKLMNYLASGLPVVASVDPKSEAARVIRDSGGGWSSDSADPSRFAQLIVEAMADLSELTRRGEAGASFARANLTADALVDRFEEIMFR